MFCCGICNAVFTGIHPETVFSTPCGHVFHGECLSMCFEKSSNRDNFRCPFCSQFVVKSKIIKLHLQICANWKDTAAALKKQANASIINLDESLRNNSAMAENCMDLNNSRFGEIQDDSVLGLMPQLPVFNANTSIINLDESFMNNSVMTESRINFNSRRKTLLTTSLSGVILTDVMEDLLFILNHVIQNSMVKKRLLMSEKKLIQSARETEYSNIIIITMSLGYPVGICFIDLTQNLKLNVPITSYEFINDKIANINNNSYLATNAKLKLNELQEFIFNFFSQPGNLFNLSTILFPCSDHNNDMKFTHSLNNLFISFIIKLPYYNDNHEYIKAIN